MSIQFRISELFNSTPDVLYNAWLESKQHTDMTGGKAVISDQVGDEFTAWDGYITGKNLDLQPPMRILQAWRTTEFKESEEDSFLEVTFIPEGEKTRVIIRHWNLPDHSMQYQQGWVDAYFTPMLDYFSEIN
jgi:uncharacterized protein YndB with AHSA1/START domain